MNDDMKKTTSVIVAVAVIALALAFFVCSGDDAMAEKSNYRPFTFEQTGSSTVQPNKEEWAR